MDKSVTKQVETLLEPALASSASPIFYVHIPKTAGTSFKYAVEQYFGSSSVVKNYGPKSVETHAIVRSDIKAPDFFKLKTLLNNEKSEIYLGHVNVLPTARVFPARSIFTLLRHPVSQVLSHYNHYQRWYGYSDTIEKFVETPGFKNIQSRMLARFPKNLLGLIGITEHYQDSLDLFNYHFKTEIDVHEKNINDQKVISEIDTELQALIEKHNSDDLALYHESLVQFGQRLELMKKGKEWCHAICDKVESTSIEGIAFWSKNDAPVELVLYVEGIEASTFLANLYMARFLQYNLSRCGHVGFRCLLPKGVDLDKVELFVKETKQKIIFD